MHKKNQVLHVKAEQEVLAKNQSDWVVKLKYSFQDDEYLYLVMEYLPGGDLMSLLMNNDIIPEDQAKLYIAEMVLAIEAVHELKCIHRDIKPDNILIDKDGHIKLSDFGLSRKADNYLYADNPVDLKMHTLTFLEYPILQLNIQTIIIIEKEKEYLLFQQLELQTT